MTQGEIEIQLLAVVVAAACALPGTFLVLRKMAMMSDAISHAILPGIVIAFFLTHNLNSPLLILAAAGTGVLTVMLVELLMSTRLVREDAAIGLTFPVLFSIGIILIARYAGDVHLDTDAVLLGEPAFAPFDRLVVGGRDIGPRALYVMSAVGLANVAFIALFYKELKIATFDAGLAAALGFGPVLIHYGLMTFVSITAVAAFDAVGSILVVAMMVAPSAAAYLLTDRLRDMILLSVALGRRPPWAGFNWPAFSTYPLPARWPRYRASCFWPSGWARPGTASLRGGSGASGRSGSSPKRCSPSTCSTTKDCPSGHRTPHRAP